jgi:hypothetical protein
MQCINDEVLRVSCNKYHDSILIIASGIIGFFCMTHSLTLPVLALIIPVLWILAANRISAFLAVFAYHLMISRSLVPGAAVFLSETHTLADACILWLVMSTGVSIPFLAFWSSNKYKKALCLFLAITFAYFLPPLALIGVVNPLIMSGCLFPASGWYGLMTMFLIYLFCVTDKRIALTFAVIMTLLPIVGMGALKNPARPPGFFAMDTSFGQLGSGSTNFERDYKRFQTVFRSFRKARIQELKDEYIVLPATIAGRLNSSGIHIWKTELKKLLRADQKAIFGGEIPTDNGNKYDNMMILLTGDDMTMIAQRIPVPYSMYKGPFTESGANLHLWENGILTLPDGRKAAVIICYEAYLSLPYILSFIKKPDLIIWTGNQWWCKDTLLPVIQERCVYLISQLFDIPVIIARNR